MHFIQPHSLQKNVNVNYTNNFKINYLLHSATFIFPRSSINEVNRIIFVRNRATGNSRFENAKWGSVWILTL